MRFQIGIISAGTPAAAVRGSGHLRVDYGAARRIGATVRRGLRPGYFAYVNYAVRGSRHASATTCLRVA
jgi:hypothetical protein